MNRARDGEMLLRVLRSGAGHPCFNMALDEALLLGGAAPPTLRLYRWAPAGLSLGYFQRAADFRDVNGEHVVVRRITGGGAIYHADEITFSLALDADLLPGPIAASYDRIHDAVRRALADVGVPATRRDRIDATELSRTDAMRRDRTDAMRRTPANPRPRQPWCFADPTSEDLLTVSGHKILGSAQRRVRTPRERVLHHGSLVLTAPAATPFCGAVADHVDPREVEADLESAIVQRVAAAFGSTPFAGDPSQEELARAAELQTARYANTAFTARR